MGWVADVRESRLFTSVLAYGVAAMAAGLGVVLILIGVALMRLVKEPEVEEPAVS